MNNYNNYNNYNNKTNGKKILIISGVTAGTSAASKAIRINPMADIKIIHILKRNKFMNFLPFEYLSWNF